MELGISIH